ncbi:lysine-specific demethylase JMJ28-like isoform X2 [Carex rostrata]
MGRRRFTDDPPPPDDLRCRRSDGRDWRCPQPSLPGLSLCIYHHRRSYKNSSFSPSPGPSSDPPPETPPTSADEKKPWKLRIRSSKRPASPSDEGGAMETPKSERTDDQKSNQRRRTNPDPPPSSPPSETANGNTKMTPIVLALAHSKGRKGKKEPEEMQSEATEGRRRRGAKPSQTETPTPTPTPVPVDSERCKRSDGRGWQCKSKASPGVGYCEHHYKRVKLLKDLRMKKNALGGAQGRKKLSAAAVAAAVKRQAEKQQQVVTYTSPAKAQEETMQLPKGLMTISPLVGSATTARGLTGDKKVGVDPAPLMVRPIRSKNCPPEPVGPVKVLPLGGKGNKKDRKKTCHRCGETKTGPAVRCLACRKRYFCSKCIKKWYYRMSKVEIKSSCPVCRGCCDCDTCTAKNVNSDDAAQKEDMNGQPKDVKIKYGTSPFSQLLPAINKFNVDQLDELEIEAKKQGKRVSSVHVQMLENGGEEELSCNNCGDLILDFSRNCSKCSYKLCITCCQKLRKEETSDKLKASDLINCKSSSCKSTSPIFHGCNLKCPSKQLGGCNNSSLGLVYLYPAGWSEALTISQEKIQLNASNSTHTESRDAAVSSDCPSRANGKVTQLSTKPQETLSGFL